MSGSKLEFDVAVIGAGAAGLCAAGELCRSGRSVVLLEARDRIGGRIDSRRVPQLDWPLELGAEFVHGQAPVTRELMRAAGLSVVDSSGRRPAQRGDDEAIRDSLFEQARRLLAPAQQLAEDLSVEQFLERQAQRSGQVEVARFVRRMVEGFDAADPARASVKAIAAEWCSDSLHRQGRPLGGYGLLLRALVHRLTPSRSQMLLETRVEAVEWAGRRVQIHASRGGRTLDVRAKRAVVALPLSILKLPAADCGAVQFDPPLAEKSAALQGMEVGPVIKVLLHFRQLFWESLREGEFADAGFLHAPGAPFPTLWTALPFHVPVLTAWTGGPQARSLSGAGREQLIHQALASAQRALGWQSDLHDELIGAHLHDWGTDAYSRGAYAYIATGGSEAPRRLAEPLRGRLFFAGDAMDPDSTGTVEAALQSGQRAAQALMAAG